MGMAATKEVMTADSIICNACQRSFNVAVSSGWRPTLKVFLASTAASIPPQGPARALATVMRSVYEALGRGEVVNSEDVERCLTEVRVTNALATLENRRNRKIVRKVLMDVSKSVSDVCARDECGDNFGDDGRNRYIYLLAMPVQPDTVVNLAREVRRKDAYRGPEEHQNIGEAARELHQALNDIAEQVASATPESVERMVLEIGAVVPQAMANVDGGGNLCMNKSAGPRTFLKTVCPDVIKYGRTRCVHAHAVDGTAEVHRDPGSEVLSEGGVSFVNAHLRRLKNNYLIRDEDGRVASKIFFGVMTTLSGCPSSRGGHKRGGWLRWEGLKTSSTLKLIIVSQREQDFNLCCDRLATAIALQRVHAIASSGTQTRTKASRRQ